MEKLEIFFEEITTKVTDFFDNLFAEAEKTKSTDTGFACGSGCKKKATGILCDDTAKGLMCKNADGQWVLGFIEE